MIFSKTGYSYRVLAPSLAVLGFVAALTSSGSAVAQAAAVTASAVEDVSASSGVTAVDEVVVTGSRSVSTTAFKSPTPVKVLSGQQLQALGANTSLRDAISTLIPSFQVQTVSSSSWNSLTRPAGLRGFGGADVLVLVNGKRRHNSALIDLSSGSPDSGAAPVDLDLIPVDAIERIEVLTDGAAAQYGSDAVAGVINIILKDNKSGGDINVSAGQRYPWRGVTDGQTVDVGGDVGIALPGDGSLTFGLDAQYQEAAHRSIPAPASTIIFAPIGGLPDPRENTINRVVYKGGLPQVRLVTGSFNLNEPIDAHWNFYSNGTISGRSALIGQNFRLPYSTNGDLPVFPNGYAPNYTLSEFDYQFLAGVKGELAKWDVDVSTTIGRDATRSGSNNTVNASLGALSPTSFWTFSANYLQWTNNIDVGRSFEVGLASPLRVTAGFEHRYENFQTIAGDPLSYANGGYLEPASQGIYAGKPAALGAQAAITLAPTDAANLSRNNVAGYIDLSAHPLQNWLVDAAGRVEHYDDSSGNTVSGKFSTRYDFNRFFAIRANVSNGFRAPSLSQEGWAQTANQYTSVGGINTYIFSKSVTPSSVIGQALGAKPLRPETSTNYSVGFTLTDGGPFRLSVDFYEIDLHHRIVQTGYLSGANVDTIVKSALTAAGQSPATWQAGSAARYFANAVDTRTQGVDVVGEYNRDLGEFGNLHLTLGYNYNTIAITHIEANPSQLAALNLTLFDRNSQGYLTVSQPKNKIILGEDWTYKRFRLSLRETYYGAVTLWNDKSPATDPRGWTENYGAKVLTDIEVAYTLPHDVTLAAGGNNIFNQYPDRNSPYIANPYGMTPYSSISPFGYYGGYYYVRASYKF